MSLFQRLSLIFKSKAHKQLDKMENPGETLDYAYARQVELLGKTRRGLVEVAAARKAIENQATGLAQKAQTYTEQAQKAITMGREDLAREALTRKNAIVPQLTDLQAQHAALQAQEQQLSDAVGQLTVKVEAFRTRKETTKAKYAAAQAQTRIAESFAGLSGDLADAGLAIQRAEDRTAQMQARAGAMDELLASGALDDLTGLSRDPLTRELDALAASTEVEAELARLKGELSGPSAPKELH